MIQKVAGDEPSDGRWQAAVALNLEMSALESFCLPKKRRWAICATKRPEHLQQLAAITQSPREHDGALKCVGMMISLGRKKVLARLPCKGD